MKWLVKLAKDLQVGDDVYLHIYSISGTVVGLNIYTIIEKKEPSNCEGIFGLGIQQVVRVLDNNTNSFSKSKTKNIEYLTLFTELPVLVKDSSNE